MIDESLRDRLAIQDVLVRYGTALDDRDWDRLATCFRPDVVSNYGSRERRGYAEIEQLCRRALEPIDLSQHFISNFEIRIDGDRATSRCYVLAQHVKETAPGGPHYLLGGIYSDELIRTADGWRITARAFRATWTEGNPSVLEGIT